MTEAVTSSVMATTPRLAPSVLASEADHIFAQLAPLVSKMGHAPVTTTSVSPSIPHVSSNSQGVSSLLTLAEALLEDLVLLAIE